MKKSVTIPIVLLAMMLLGPGMASAAEPLPSGNSAVLATAQDDPHSLANRNAAAKALKAKLDKQKAAATARNTKLNRQNAAKSDQAN